ncbi:hypothetical protein GW17_00040973 [Ensete ventricosum]|nr:hypothetical protein GW17_00040973 [Ensete ventricosum]
MHPLKFPNSGIRAKVFVRKIGFKLRVMRLKRVESFYVFLLCFCSEGSEEGRLATGSPHAGPATHGQAGCKGQLATSKAPYKGAASHGQSPLQGKPPAGAVAHGHGWRLRAPAARAASCKGDRWQEQLPRKAAPLAREVPPEGTVSPPVQGSGGTGGADGARGLGHPFRKRMILPL